MIRWRRPVAAIFLLLALFLWRLGCGVAARVPLQEAATLRSYTPLTAAAFVQMKRAEARAGEETPFVLWTQLEGQEIAAVPLKRTTEAAVVLTRGDTRLLFPAALAEGDSTGALVDRATARALFGEGEATGGRIDCLGKKRVIRAVLDIPLPTVVIQADPTDETPLLNVTFSSPRKEAFTLRHGLSGMLTENRVWGWLAGFVCGLPAVMACVWGIWALTRASVRCHRYPARQGVLLVALLLFATLCALGFLATLPKSWVPPRWSNFGFWPERFETWKREALELLAARKYRSDLYLMAKAGRAAICGILSCGALAVCGKRIVDFLPRR